MTNNIISTNAIDFAIFGVDGPEQEAVHNALKTAKRHNVLIEIVDWRGINGIELVKFKGTKSDIVNFGMELMGIDEELAIETFFDEWG